MAGAYVVTRHRKNMAGTVTVDAFGPYPQDVAERCRERANLIEQKRPVLLRGAIHVVELEPRLAP